MFTVLRPPPTTPMWAQQAIFSFLFYAILCSKTSSPAFDDRFSWEAFMHGCLPTLTVPDVTRLMTAVFKNQYDTNNPATVAQEEWGVIPRLWAFLPLYHPWLQTSSPAAPAVVGCCSSGCRAKETETGDFYCSGCQHTVTRERPCASTSFSKYHQIWELLEDKACSHFSTQILKKKKKNPFFSSLKQFGLSCRIPRWTDVSKYQIYRAICAYFYYFKPHNTGHVISRGPDSLQTLHIIFGKLFLL